MVIDRVSAEWVTPIVSTVLRVCSPIRRSDVAGDGTAPAVSTVVVLFVVTATGVLLFTVAGVGASTADETAELETVDGIDVPPQSVEFLGESIDVDEVATADADGTVELDVSVPDDEAFLVVLTPPDVLAEGGIPVDPVEFLADADTVSGTGSETVALSANDFGTYGVALFSGIDDPTSAANGAQPDAVIPVVVDGYEVTVDYDGAVGTDESTVDVGVTVDPTYASGPPNVVEVAFWDDEGIETAVADPLEDSTTEYHASIPIDDRDPGTYDLVAMAAGEESILGGPEPLAMSANSTVEIEDRESGSVDDGSADPGGADAIDTDGDADEVEYALEPRDGDVNETEAGPRDDSSPLPLRTVPLLAVALLGYAALVRLESRSVRR